MQKIRYALFFILFNVDIYRVCLILLLLLLSLLLNVTAFAISSLKLQTFVRITVIVHKSRSPPIMKGSLTKVTLTNSLKSPLTKSPFEVGNWKLNEMAGSDGCLRQNLRWVINFWISEIKQYEETIANIRGRVAFLSRGQVSSFKVNVCALCFLLKP